MKLVLSIAGGILLAVAVLTGGWYLLQLRTESKVRHIADNFTDAQTFVREQMKTPLTAYRISIGDYPSTQEGLQALLVAPAGKAAAWRGPYADLTDGTQLAPATTSSPDSARRTSPA